MNFRKPAPPVHRYRCVEPRVGQQILSLREESLDADLREELRDHLEICRHCQGLLELEDALRDGLARGDFGPRATRPIWRRSGALMVAAAVLMLIFSFTMFQPDTSVSDVPSMGFIENVNVVDSTALYYTVGSHGSVYFQDDGVIFDLRSLSQDSLLMKSYRFILDLDHPEYRERGSSLRLRFVGAGTDTRIEGRRSLETRHHFFIGKDPDAWRLDQPAYAELVYRGLWPGVDLVFREESGRITYHLEGESATGMTRPPFVIEGADSLDSSDPEGARVYHTSEGEFVELPPDGDRDDGVFLWMDEAESRSLWDTHSADNRDRLRLSSFIGGYEFKVGTSLALDRHRNIVVGGLVATLGVPGSPGLHDEMVTGQTDAFIAKLSPDGNRLLWCTYLGGEGGIESVGRILVRDDDTIVATGRTNAPDFPTTAGAHDESYSDLEDEARDPGYHDSFIVTLGAEGNTLEYATFLGGSGSDKINDLCVDESGDLYLVGGTSSADFPKTDDAAAAPRSAENRLASSDLFVAKITGDLSTLEWSTVIGGEEQDQGFGIAQRDGAVFIVGMTGSRNFPTTSGSPQPEFGGGRFDCLVASLNANTGALRWSSFLGGEGDWDYAFDVGVDERERVIVTGSAFSADFPVTDGAFDTSYNCTVEKGGNDVFLSVISRDGGELIYSSYLGGGHTDFTQALALGHPGEVYLVGHTASSDFPVTPGSYDVHHNGGNFDAFLVRFDWERGVILDASLLGGSGDDWGWSLALADPDTPVILGQTSSLNFPTTPGAYDRTPNRTLFDIFVAKLVCAPEG